MSAARPSLARCSIRELAALDVRFDVIAERAGRMELLQDAF